MLFWAKAIQSNHWPNFVRKYASINATISSLIKYYNIPSGSCQFPRPKMLCFYAKTQYEFKEKHHGKYFAMKPNTASIGDSKNLEFSQLANLIEWIICQHELFEG